MSVFCKIYGELESNFDLIGDILTADIIFTKAERAALFGALGARAPANGSHTVGTILASRVAQSTALYLFLVALQRFFFLCSRVGKSRTAGTNIYHSSRAVWRADTAADIMIVFVAFGVPERTPLFCTFVLMDLTSASAVGIRLAAVITIFEERFWAVLPAIWSITMISFPTNWIAYSTMPFQAFWALGHGLSNSATGSSLPA